MTSVDVEGPVGTVSWTQGGEVRLSRMGPVLKPEDKSHRPKSTAISKCLDAFARA